MGCEVLALEPETAWGRTQVWERAEQIGTRKELFFFCFGMLHTKCRDSTVSKHARSCGEAVSKTGRAEVACKSLV